MRKKNLGHRTVPALSCANVVLIQNNSVITADLLFFVSFMRKFRLFSTLAGRRLRLALEAISRAPTARGQ
jgi:hypothetical protein